MIKIYQSVPDYCRKRLHINCMFVIESGNTFATCSTGNWGLDSRTILIMTGG